MNIRSRRNLRNIRNKYRQGISGIKGINEGKEEEDLKWNGLNQENY